MTKDEAAAILALLEAEYASEKEAAQAVFDGVVELLRKRHAFGVGLDGIAWGPYYSLTEAKKVAGNIGGRVAKLYAPAPLVDKVLKVYQDSNYCEECNHPKIAHCERYWTEWRGEPWAREPGCSVPQCQCKQVYPQKKAA